MCAYVEIYTCARVYLRVAENTAAAAVFIENLLHKVYLLLWHRVHVHTTVYTHTSTNYI